MLQNNSQIFKLSLRYRFRSFPRLAKNVQIVAIHNECEKIFSDQSEMLQHLNSKFNYNISTSNHLEFYKGLNAMDECFGGGGAESI